MSSLNQDKENVASANVNGSNTQKVKIDKFMC